MTIIVEAGATKSDWRLISGDGSAEARRFRGMNVSTMPMPTVLEHLSEALEALRGLHPSGVYIYVAGIVTPEVVRTLSAPVREAFGECEIEVADDMLASARAVCGRAPGIVAILGTGSNTCFYDGSEVWRKVRSGGYIIGDEGGGAVLGKLFLADFIKGLVPEGVAADFAAQFDASYEGIVELVYKSPAPAAALGGLAPFILEHYSDPYVKALIEGNFRAFIERSLRSYDTASYPVGVVGGWGYACRDIFSRLCAEAGIRTGEFLPAPVEGLIRYHTVFSSPSF